MRISRIYITDKLLVDQQIGLNEKTSHYLTRVLRLQQDNTLVLFNGDGHDYHAEIIETGKKQVRVNILSQSEKKSLPSLPIQLGLSLSKGDRFDIAIQKATELGVSHITPLLSEFSTLKLSADRLDKKMLHWQGIIQSACEQSGRAFIPWLDQPVALQSWLTSNLDGLKLTLHPQASKTLRGFENPDRLVFLVGPEGGLSENEIDLANEQGFQTIKLGNYILRTETAPLAAISAAQVLWGDF